MSNINTPNGRTVIFNMTLGVWGDADSGRIVWLCKDNRALTLEEMETEHIRNCIGMIFAGDHTPGWRKNYLGIFTNELKRRRDQDVQDTGPAERPL